MQNDSPDAAVPRGEQPEPRQSPKTRDRYLSIDVLRGLAILLMIQVHAVDSFSVEVREWSPIYLYNLSEIFGFMAAPIFTLLSGLSYSLWLQAQKRSAL